MRSLVDFWLMMMALSIERMIDPVFILGFLLLMYNGKHEIYFWSIGLVLIPVWVIFSILPYLGLSADLWFSSGSICNQAPLGFMKLGWCWRPESGFNMFGWRSFSWDMVNWSGAGGQ